MEEKNKKSLEDFLVENLSQTIPHQPAAKGSQADVVAEAGQQRSQADLALAQAPRRPQRSSGGGYRRRPTYGVTGRPARPPMPTGQSRQSVPPSAPAHAGKTDDGQRRPVSGHS